MTGKATEFFPGGIKQFKKDFNTQLMAVQALADGVASERQQQIALAFIIKTLCRADDINFFQDERDTSFALGREAVGKVLRGFIQDKSWTNIGDKE